MPIDPRKLRPAELVRLLNSTPLGPVIDDRQLYRHRQRGGYRFGDNQHIDLFRYGHREFVCLIGSDEGHAMDMLDSIKTELDSNDTLLDDFPEVCYPIHSLDGIANRCNGQLYNGDRTHISWTAKEIVLPTVKPARWRQHDILREFVRDDGVSLASGAIIKVAGITGRIRGMKTKKQDGRSPRNTATG